MNQTNDDAFLYLKPNLFILEVNQVKTIYVFYGTKHNKKEQ